MGIYQAEVCHPAHAYILLIIELFEVVIPKIAFKFGANNFNFIRVRLGQVRLDLDTLCKFLCYLHHKMSIIFVISTSNNPIINTINA